MMALQASWKEGRRGHKAWVSFERFEAELVLHPGKDFVHPAASGRACHGGAWGWATIF